MKKLLSTLTQVVFNPQRATPYSLFSTDDPQEPYLDNGAILVLYVAALTPFWVGAAILGIGVTTVLAFSMLIWWIGLILGAIHLNFGLLTVLALGLLSLANQNLKDFAWSISSDLWPLGLLFIYLPLFSALQVLARSREKSLYRILQAGLTIVVGGLGVGLLYLSNQLTTAHIWTTVALGMLSLVGSTEIGDDEALSIFSAFIAFLAGIGTSWHLYPLIFPPDSWTGWLRVVQILFSVIVPFLMSVIVAVDMEAKREFDHSWQLLFFLFVALSPSTAIPSALLIGLLAVASKWLAFPTLPKFQKRASISARIAIITTCAAVCVLVTTMFIKSFDYRFSLALLFLAQFPPGLHLIWLFIVVGVLFSISGLHWTAFLAAAVATVGPILLGSDALGVAASLVAIGLVLGFTRIFLWPLMSLLTLWQKNQIQQSTDSERADYLPAVALAEVRSWPRPSGNESLLITLAQKGIPAEAFDRDKSRQAYRTIQANRCVQMIRSARTLQEVLQMDITTLSDGPLKSGIESLKEAENEIRDIRKVRAYAGVLQRLTSIVETESEKATDVLQGEMKALEALIQFAYEEIHPAVEVYWRTYSAFPEFAKISVDPDGLISRREIQEGIEQCLSRLRTIPEELSAMGAHLGNLPRGERSHFREIEDISRQLMPLPREVDYMARTRLLQNGLSRINKIRDELEPVWFAIDQNVDRVIDHENPWMALLDATEDPISRLAQLNDRIIEWATTEVVKALKRIQSVEEVGSLTEDIEDIAGFRESYGPIIDTTIESLAGIGRDATAALAFPKGYNRRLGLQDTLDRVNKLRSDLSTRFLLETEGIVEHLERVAQVLYRHLYAASERQAGDYRNPYIAGNPIGLDRAALFKGRLDLAESIVTLLRSRGNPTVILYGPRRMGKTSFLLQLPRLLPPNYLPVFLDMQQGGAQQSDGSFTYALAYAIWKQLRRETAVQRPDLDEHERHPYTAMEVWLDDIRPIIGERILFFTIDEFEVIGQAIERGALTVQVLGHLRSLMQHNDNLNLMFAGVQTIDALGPDPASYFISAHPVEISYLHPKEAEELIRNPDPRAGKMPAYNDEVIAHLLRITHCQPYLVQAICSEVVQIAIDQQLTSIKMDTLDQAAANVLSTSLFFQNIWDDATEEGWEVLRQLAAGPAKLNEMEIEEDVLDGLLRRHVICRTDEVYTIEIPLVRDWIRREIVTE